MKATGVVRRIDDLGRVVIPKEIRRSMHMNEGDPVEIFVSDETVVLRKYSLIGELKNAEMICDVLYRDLNMPLVLCSMDKIITSFGIDKKVATDATLSPELQQALEKRAVYEKTEDDNLFPFERIEMPANIIIPIICDSDLLGGIIVFEQLGQKPMTEEEKRLAILASRIIVKTY